MCWDPFEWQETKMFRLKSFNCSTWSIYLLLELVCWNLIWLMHPMLHTTFVQHHTLALVLYKAQTIHTTITSTLFSESPCEELPFASKWLKVIHLCWLKFWRLMFEWSMRRLSSGGFLQQHQCFLKRCWEGLSLIYGFSFREKGERFGTFQIKMKVSFWCDKEGDRVCVRAWVCECVCARVCMCRCVHV